jgi:outer membrane protein assembly factor BamE (lipoprotein component of BamABCDE complex)
LLGKTRSEIETMLGAPTQTDKFRDYDLVYWLGDERGYMSIDSEWLAMRFDKTNKTSKAIIVCD